MCKSWLGILSYVTFPSRLFLWRLFLRLTQVLFPSLGWMCHLGRKLKKESFSKRKCEQISSMPALAQCGSTHRWQVLKHLKSFLTNTQPITPNCAKLRVLILRIVGLIFFVFDFLFVCFILWLEGKTILELLWTTIYNLYITSLNSSPFT